VHRPTISDLAEAAGVSVSTVNRILHGTGPVRGATKEAVLEAAERIGFYGANAIRERNRRARPSRTLGVLLQQSHRPIYQEMAARIVEAARRREDVSARPLVRFADDLRPDAIAATLLELGRESDAVGIVAPDHPLIAQAIGLLADAGKPVFAYITDLSTSRRAGYVGTDNWKLGRTAAWFITQMAARPGKLLSFIGNHRYQCQDINDASFRSYVREHFPEMEVLDAMPTHEEPENAYRMVRELLSDEDIVGLFISGGGISGVLRALRELPPARRRTFRVVCRDIGPETRTGLTEGLITAALCHPLDRMADELVDVMVAAPGPAAGVAAGASIVHRSVPFTIVTPESV
jgi:LacI family transcriptional regulator